MDISYSLLQWEDMRAQGAMLVASSSPVTSIYIYLHLIQQQQNAFANESAYSAKDQMTNIPFLVQITLVS